MVLQRVAHDVWGSAQELWLSERVMQILLMWHRYAVFSRCKREGQGIPVFALTVEKWDRFLDVYHDRKLRETLSRRMIGVVSRASAGSSGVVAVWDCFSVFVCLCVSANVDVM